MQIENYTEVRTKSNDAISQKIRLKVIFQPSVVFNEFLLVSSPFETQVVFRILLRNLMSYPIKGPINLKPRVVFKLKIFVKIFFGATKPMSLVYLV